MLRELNDAAKVAIVDKHNELRAKVARGEETNGPQPKASNMRKLVNFLNGYGYGSYMYFKCGKRFGMMSWQ